MTESDFVGIESEEFGRVGGYARWQREAVVDGFSAVYGRRGYHELYSVETRSVVSFIRHNNPGELSVNYEAWF